MYVYMYKSVISHALKAHKRGGLYTTNSGEEVKTLRHYVTWK